jgi:hypothetical protein
MSPTQLEVLRRMAAEDGEIRRVPGGYWISGHPGVKNEPPPSHVKSCDIRTVRALERQGFIKRKRIFPEEWRDTRSLTEEGRAQTLPVQLAKE